jgi:superfamily II DNA or RNA helicase
MSRLPRLTYDRGTLILHPPPRGKAWIEFATWDDRIERFRIPAIYYSTLIHHLQAEGIQYQDHARDFSCLDLQACVRFPPYSYQQEALTLWQEQERQGVVVLPTAAGKTYLAQLAMQVSSESTLIVVPTLDLMQQWYTHLRAAFPDIEVGLLGGGSQDYSLILVATYTSAAIYAEKLGNRYGLLIFDECHHLPSDFYRVIAEYSLAPHRLGLTATPERSDSRHHDLSSLIGPEIYRKTPQDLAGETLAAYQVIQIAVSLSKQEQSQYQALMQIRNTFLQKSKLSLGTLEGWQRFVQISARSAAGREAMRSHHEAKALALGTESKLRVLSDLLSQHHGQQILIFTHDNATVYRISQDFLIPAITHQTPVKERYKILAYFRQRIYLTLVVANVLDEGIDVPEVSIAIMLAGSGSTRQFIQRLGRILRKGNTVDKQAILYEVIAENTTEDLTSQRRRKQDPEQPKHLPFFSGRAAEKQSAWPAASPPHDPKALDEDNA